MAAIDTEMVPCETAAAVTLTLRLMTSSFVCVGARLYGALTSSDDAQAPPVSGHAPLEFILPSFTHLGETMLHLWQ